jgi:hypothetical protein
VTYRKILNYLYFSNTFLIPVNGTINNQNIMFGNPRVRISMRKYKNHTNNNPKTNKAVSTKVTNRILDFDDDLGDEEYIDPIQIRNGDFWVHTPAGTRDSPLSKGGYIGQIEAGNIFVESIIEEIYKGPVVDEYWAIIILEFVYFNRNYEFVAGNNVIFIKSAAGITGQKYLTSVVEDHYDSGLDYFRAFLELVLVLLFLFYFVRT